MIGALSDPRSLKVWCMDRRCKRRGAHSCSTSVWCFYSNPDQFNQSDQKHFDVSTQVQKQEDQTSFGCNKTDSSSEARLIRILILILLSSVGQPLIQQARWEPFTQNIAHQWAGASAALVEEENLWWWGCHHGQPLLFKGLESAKTGNSSWLWLISSNLSASTAASAPSIKLKERKPHLQELLLSQTQAGCRFSWWAAETENHRSCCLILQTFTPPYTHTHTVGSAAIWTQRLLQALSCPALKLNEICYITLYPNVIYVIVIDAALSAAIMQCYLHLI